MSGLRKIGSVSMWAGLIGTAIFFLRTGRRLPPPEEEAVASAHERAGNTEEHDEDQERSGR